MLLQAYLDDSGTKGTGKVLLIGGLIGTAEVLAATATEWDSELKRPTPRPIEYFKAYEARRRIEQFEKFGLKGRDEKVRRLAAVIDRDDLVMTFCSVDLGAHQQLEQMAVPCVDAKKTPFNQPYLMAFLTVLMAVALEAWKQKSDQKVEVIIDEHVIFRRDALAQYEMVREMMPPWLQAFMPIQPLFRDDKDFVMLQAADLLMGHARMTAEKTSRWPELEFDKIKASPFIKMHWAQTLGEIGTRQLERQ